MKTFKMKSIFLALLALPLFAGCTGMGGMTTEQITAATKDKSSAAACTTYTGTGGQLQVMVVNNDKTFNTGGGKTTIKCGSAEVTFEDAGKAAPPK